MKKICEKKKKDSRSEFLFNRNILNSKRSQASVIIVVLLILLALIITVIIWRVVRWTVKEKAEQIEVGTFSVNLDIRDVRAGVGGGIDIDIHRYAGEGNISSLRFILEDINRETYHEDSLDIIYEIETKTYNVFTGLSGVEAIKVSVVPVVGERYGIESIREIDIIIA